MWVKDDAVYLIYSLKGKHNEFYFILNCLHKTKRHIVTITPAACYCSVEIRKT